MLSSKTAVLVCAFRFSCPPCLPHLSKVGSTCPPCPHGGAAHARTPAVSYCVIRLYEDESFQVRVETVLFTPNLLRKKINCSKLVFVKNGHN